MKILYSIIGLFVILIVSWHISSALTYQKISQGYMVGRVISYDCVGEGDYPCTYTVVSNGNKYRLKAHDKMYIGIVDDKNKIIQYERVQKGFTDTYYLQ